MGCLSLFCKAKGTIEFFGKTNFCISPGQQYRSFLSPTQQHRQQHRNPALLPSDHRWSKASSVPHITWAPFISYPKGQFWERCSHTDLWVLEAGFSQVRYQTVLTYLYYTGVTSSYLNHRGRVDTKTVYTEKANGSWGICVVLLQGHCFKFGCWLQCK